MNRFRIAVAISGCVLLVSVIVLAARADQAANKPAKLQQLYRDREVLAEEAFVATNVAYEAGVVTLDQLLTASNELARAKLDLCKTKDERIGVLKEHVTREKDIEGKIRRLAAANAKGGEAEKVARSGFNRADAEIALEIEQTKKDADR